MSKGDLDDTRELDKPDEGLGKRAAANDWFEGTSRDLLFNLEAARADSVDVAKPATADSSDLPVTAGPVADLDAPRNDGRDDALRDFPLDDSSTAVAEETGAELARSTAQDRLERASLQEELAPREEASETIASQLDIDVPAQVADSTMTRLEHGDSVANSVHDNSELLASLREPFNPVLIAAQLELMQDIGDNADYKAKFVSGAAVEAGVHATELVRPAVDLLHRDMVGAADGLMSAAEHVSGLIEAAKMLRDGLDFPVIPDEVRQRAQAIAEWWNALNPPQDKPR